MRVMNFVMFRDFQSLAMLFLALISAPTFAQSSAQVSAQSSPELAERVLVKSGTIGQLEGIATQFKANFEQAFSDIRDAPFTKSEIKKLAESADPSFAAQKSRQILVNVIAERVTPSNLKTIDVWYESEIGKRMLSLEADAAKAPDQRASIQAGAALLSRMSAARAEALEQLVAASRSPDFVADLSINMAVSAAYAASVATDVAAGRKSTLAMSDLRKGASRDRAPMVKSMSEVLHAAYAKTYEKATDEEVSAYVAHLKSEAGQQFAGAVIAAFDQLLLTNVNDFATQLSAPPPRQRR